MVVWFAAVAVVAMFGWWRWPQFDPASVSAPPTKTENRVPRETLNGHHPPPRLVTLPEEVVIRAMDIGRAAFVQCFKRAIKADPSTVSFKVRVHIELDATGKITSGNTDAVTPALGNCLLRVAYGLPYGSAGKPAAVDVPLIYRE